MTPLLLRDLQLLTRIGLTALVAVLGLGVWASILHIVHHYERRDGLAGLTVDDITAAYRGINVPAPLAAALERGHPESLDAPEREALLRWLGSERLTEEYDALELGDDAPAEIIARECLSCHSRTASPPTEQRAALDLPLDYWDDVQAAAIAREAPATPRQIVIMSMHAHALTMGVMTIVAGALSLATAWPRGLSGGLIAIAGVGLLVDLAGWLLAPAWSPAIAMIVGGGAAYNIAFALLLLLVVVELWRPRLRGTSP